MKSSIAFASCSASLFATTALAQDAASPVGTYNASYTTTGIQATVQSLSSPSAASRTAP
jgi:hypothetical protein